MPQSRTCKPAGLRGAVIVTNVTRESGIAVVLAVAAASAVGMVHHMCVQSVYTRSAQ